MMSTDAIATELLDALDQNRRVPPLTDRDRAFDARTAYLVSAELLRRRRARGERPIGRKVGFTNRQIWPEYGVFEPIWAHVYDTTVTFLDETSGSLPISHLSQPRIEPEIVIHFKTAPAATKDEAELLSSVDWIAHGCEIVQTHFPAWKFKAADTIADFGLHGALVIGPRHSVDQLPDAVRKLRTFCITLSKNGHVEGTGGGWNVLESPLLAAAHLLQVLDQQPQFEPVQAGELVTTGTLMSPPLVQAGEVYVTELSGIDLPGFRLQFV